MPWYRPRFTVRRLMVVVAIVGLLLGASLWVLDMRIRSTAYRRRALEVLGMQTSDFGNGGVFTKDGRYVNGYHDENDWLRDAWASKLAGRYWRLSHYPWLPVEPDPPPPERLAHPRRTVELPAEMDSARWFEPTDAPWWTFLWTWRPK